MEQQDREMAKLPVRCDKQRNGEWEGSIGLWYHRDSQQYVGANGDEPLILYRNPEADF